MSTATGIPNGGSGSQRPIWIAVFLIFATIVGVCVGLLVYANDASVSAALLAGGGTFAGAVFLQVAIYEFVVRKTT
jgi:hypothetical protein